MGLKYWETMRRAENREEWTSLIVTSSETPNEKGQLLISAFDWKMALGDRGHVGLSSAHHTRSCCKLIPGFRLGQARPELCTLGKVYARDEFRISGHLDIPAA
ncbi:hypothetical protein PoB_000825100 [Plakobranchus ocellatus]|uniref:Uncharacterized protein n=1 Tax=Plakobranchus ocellatus TaxID=259542 RepID=A0AAV3YHA0_9GAST|nr:hypothetical protein PoB_000825100 [Plakobranchus ocellatus]